MYYATFLFLLLSFISVNFSVISGQKYFGYCSNNQCGNLTCVELFENEPAYSCYPACDNTTTRDCASPMNCTQRSCQNGATCHQFVDHSVCRCPVGFSGEQCTTNIEVVCPEQCSNHSDKCTQETGQDVVCQCGRNRAGENCTVYICVNIVPCGQYGTCMSVPDDPIDGYKCICNPGYTGKLCVENIDECAAIPCKNNASCTDTPGSFWCNCTGNWTGQSCDVLIGQEETTTQMDICTLNQCLSKTNNGMCDSECDLQECSFDNTECTFSVPNPWESCMTGTGSCDVKFGNGMCDAECNNENCLYDGFDCLNAIVCPDSSCYMTVNDGMCDDACNSSACFFDGNDCGMAMGPNSTYLGTLILKFHKSSHTSETNALSMFNYIAQKIGRGSSAGLFVRERSENMIYYQGNNMWKVYFDVVNLYSCYNSTSFCWMDIEMYQKALAAYLRNQTNMSNNISSIAVSMCQEGQYGDTCGFNCSKGCQPNTCSAETGNCDCLPGYYGDRCDGLIACRYCKNDTCENEICIYGCKAGYQGEFCNETCMDGYYGDGCNMTCSPNCMTTCNKTTGICTHGCHTGYIGDMCDMRCHRGYYGTNCNNRCSGHCVHNDACHHTTGHCDRGCAAGYDGHRCDMACKDGYYGNDCMGRCGQCKSGPCNKENGRCGSCKLGWTGVQCKLKAPEPQNQRSTNSNIIVAVVVVIILVLVAVIVAICVWKRRQKEKYKMEETEKEMNPVYKGRQPSTAENGPDTAVLLTASSNREIDLEEARLVINNENGIDSPVINLDDEKEERGGVYTGDDRPESELLTNETPVNQDGGPSDETVPIVIAADDNVATPGDETQPKENDISSNTEDKKDTDKEESDKRDSDRKSSTSSSQSTSSTSSEKDKENDDERGGHYRPVSGENGETGTTTAANDGVLYTPM